MSRVSITFVGTATTVIRVGTFTLLTDPNFLPSLSTWGEASGPS